MISIDERTVKMEFDNAKFMQRAGETKKTLDDVNKSVDSAGKSKGLLDLNSNMERVSVTASKMQIVATTALATIANKAVNAGLSVAKSLTFDPIKQGFTEYESLLTKQNVIMNATGASAKKVKSILNELNTYSDKTIYNFGDMTDAISKFVNAGVPLDKSVMSIRGIGNAAAFAGANSGEASRAMYAFTQMMQAGYIGLQDWKQVENANMGTVQFKQTLIDSAVAAGTLTKKGKDYLTTTGKTISATKGWNKGLQEQWATSKVLTTALAKYADTSTELGKKAFDSATKVRTFTAFMSTLKESIGSGWSQIFTAMIGGLGSSTRMWTKLSQEVGKVTGTFFDFATQTLTTWRALGGFRAIIHGIKNILSPFVALFQAVGQAYQDAFPSAGGSAGKALFTLSKGFEALTQPLRWLSTIIPSLVGPLTVFFQLIRVGGQMVGRVVGIVRDFVTGIVSAVDIDMPETGGVLGYIKKIGVAIAGALDKIGDLMAKGKSLRESLGSVDISLPGLPDFGSMLGGGDKAKGAMSGVGDEAASVGDKVSTVFAKMGEGLRWIKDQLANLFDGMTAEDVVASFNLAVLSTLALSISRFLNTMSTSVSGFKGTGKVFKETLGKAGDALGSFQTQARAKLILNIAIAIGILAASLWVLSKIPREELLQSLGAIGVLFFILNKTMENFVKNLKGTDGVVKGFNFVALAFSITLLAVAMILLATACLLMNKVEWQSIAKGLITMAAAMKLMESLGNLSKGAARNMIGGAFAIGLIAGSMIVLAGALLLFQLVKWESIGKAGAVLGGLTLAVGALALIPYQGIAKVGLALLTASIGMLAIANALLLFGLVKWGSIGKAAVVLGLLALALLVIMAVGGPGAAGTLLALSAAMIGLALACIIFNNVEWASIAKATVVLTVLLLALAVGAVILTAFLYAIAPIAPVLVGLAVGFALLGLGMLAFASAMAIAMALGAAGTAVFAALATGAAVAIAVFLQTLALQAPIMKKSFLAILQQLIDTIVEAVPMVIQGIKDLWAAVKKEFQDPSKKKDMGDSGKDWIQKLYDGINKQMPRIVDMAGRLIVKFINGLAENAADISAAGVNLLIQLIKGISSRIGALQQAGGNLIIKWISGMATQYGRIADAAAKAVIKFINSMSQAIDDNSEAMGKAMGNLGVQMVKGLITGVTSMGGEAVGALKDLAGNMIKAAKDKFKIFSPSRVFRDIGAFLVQGLTNGVSNNAASAITAVASMVGGQIATAESYVSKFVQRLDQQALKARGTADGIAAAADKAAKAADRQARAAEKTKKNKKDDRQAAKAQKAAEKLGSRATALDAAATRAEERAQKASDKAERKREFDGATLIDQAKMRSEDAQTNIDEAKEHEKTASSYLTQANALDRQSKAKGVSAKERKAMQKEADRLRAKAKREALAANKSLGEAKLSAADAIRLQGLAGAEAAAAFQKEYDDAAKDDADTAAFEKLSDAEKAKARREAAAKLQADSEKDLAAAKILAKTDLDAANDLADQALAEAQRARDYLDEAATLEQGAGTTPGKVVNLDPTEAASLAFNGYADTFDAANARVADGASVEFNQYITSPDPADPAEVYRRTNNALDFGAAKLIPAA